jgi:hypothetical protein
MATLDKRLEVLEAAAMPEPINMLVTFRAKRDAPLKRIWSDNRTVHREPKESDAAFESRAREILGQGIIFGDSGD